MSDRFNQHWNTYLADVLPAGASKVQIQETRRAFYAGATALLGEMVTMLDAGLEPTDADLGKMDEIAAELTAFSQAIRGGRA
jgi:methyl coenzyme M reductase beta subunit